MENIKNLQLTVAKVCHEMANHLSIMKFIQEDLVFSQCPEVKELMSSVDLLTLTMDFFRSIYAPFDGVSYDIYKTLSDILRLKEISVVDDTGIILNLPGGVKNIVCGILYCIIKVSKQKDVIKLSGTLNNILIESPQNRSVSKVTYDTFNSGSLESNVFNIFENYIKYLASLNKVEVSIETENGNQKVRVWKK